MSTNTADMLNYHPAVTKRTIADYNDILHVKRPQTKDPMSISARAAQFSPYAALVGHKDIIAEDEDLANTKINIDQEVTIDYDI